MRWSMRKHLEMSVRRFRTRVDEINNYLEQFPDDRFDEEGIPTGFSADQKMDDDSLADDMMNGLPNSWNRKLTEHGFDPLEHDDPKGMLVKFCEEHIESLEVEQGGPPTKKNKTEKKPESGFKSGGCTPKIYDQTKHCELPANQKETREMINTITCQQLLSTMPKPLAANKKERNVSLRGSRFEEDS
jgi:hypothetical protein